MAEGYQGNNGDNASQGNIGNYKGVMLCNRPNEPGELPYKERQGPPPFVSRVDPKDALGINKQRKELLLPKKPDYTKEVMKKHKKFIRELNNKKRKEKDMKEAELNQMKQKDKTVKLKSAAHREKIQKWKNDMKVINKVIDEKKEVPQDNLKPAILTEKNLETHQNLETKKVEQEAPPITNTDKPTTKKHTPKKKKPMWAMTEKQVEEMKEQEVDDLIEFAYQLDYEKFIEDFEVKQALLALKERVQELKKDDKWKEEFAEKWNKSEQKPKVEEIPAVKENQPNEKAESVRSKTKSIKSIIDAKKEAQSEVGKKEWNVSVKGSEHAATAEDKAAMQIAEQVLLNAPHLKNIHSKASIRKVLENEARKQLRNHSYEPRIVTIVDHDKPQTLDPSNLPYLHRNEAV